MIDPGETQTDSSRAKEIDSGAPEQNMQNVILDLPSKPGLQFDNRESVNATKWAFEQLIGQKQYLTTIEVKDGNSSAIDDGKVLFILPNTWETIANLHFRKFKNLFFLKSWKWHLTFEIRSNFQEFGMLSIVAVNCPVSAFPYITGGPICWVDHKLTDIETAGKKGLPSNDLITAHSIFKLGSIVQLPHKHIMLGENHNVNVSMNWLSPFKSSFRNTVPLLSANIYNDDFPSEYNNDYDMGFIYLANPIPLTTASGVTPNCTIRVWSQLTDVEYGGYCPTDEIL